MTLTERRLGDVTILDLAGRLVLEEGEAVLRERIQALAAGGRLNIVLNLREVTQIDSCGVGVLIANFVRLRRKGGDLRLLHLTARIRHILEITRLLGVFRIFDSEADALASFSGEPAS